MAELIKINPELVRTAITDLQTLKNSSVLEEALQVLLSAVPDKSSGKAASAVKAFDDFSDMVVALKNLFELTVSALQVIDASFTMTDEELDIFFQKQFGGS
jgi:hypothetical protein